MSVSSYRPLVSDLIAGRCKHGYYGGFPVGLLERVRSQLPVLKGEGVWFFASGGIKKHKGTVGGIPLNGLTKNDVCFDINPAVKPDFVVDLNAVSDWEISRDFVRVFETSGNYEDLERPRAIVIDLPYNEEHRKEYVRRYKMPDVSLPKLPAVLAASLEIVLPGGRVAVVDWQWPRMDRKKYKCVSVINVMEGENKAVRVVTVWEKR